MLRFSLIEEGSSTTDAFQYTTSSISAGANKLLIACVSHRFSTNPQAFEPSLSGASLTWTKIVTTDSVPHNSRVTLFRAVTGDSGATGALTITISSNQVQQNCHWQIVEVSNAVIGGTNGSLGIVQSGVTTPADGSSSATVTLSTINTAKNATLGYITKLETTINQGGGFTELSEVFTSDVARTSQVEYQIGTDDTVDWSFGASNDIAAVAVEIKAKADGGHLLTII